MQRAIVLRSWLPEKQRIMIFDEQLGRFTALIRSGKEQPRVLQGGMILYHTRHWRGLSILQAMELIAVPVPLWSADIQFIHMILELLECFVAEHDPLPELFRLCTILYTPIPIAEDQLATFKRLFLCKLFSVLGVYPSERVYEYAHDVRRLISEPLVALIDTSGYSNLGDEARTWLLGCIHTSPHVSLCRTLLM